MSTPSGPPQVPETPGPDATPEQEVFARSLLGGLRADDPPMPEHVTARMDAVLAEERRTAGTSTPQAASTTSPGPLAASPDEDRDGEDAGPALAPVTVLPQRSRPARSSTALQWLVGAAAAVLVVGGVGAVARGTLGGSGSDSAASLAEGAAAPLVATGTAYTKQNLAEEAQQLASVRSGPASAEGLDGGTGGDTGADPVEEPAAEPSGATDGSSRGPTVTLLTASTLSGCLEQLTGAPGATPVAVDQASYDGRPAVVIVLASVDDPASLDVWVVGPGCTRESADLLEFQRVPAP